MMEIALTLMACAVFAALTAVAVTAALKSARVDDVIGEVFSPWIHDPFEAPAAPKVAEPPRADDDAPTRQPPGSGTVPEDRPAVAAGA
jgi:hypothetical protein